MIAAPGGPPRPATAVGQLGKRHHRGTALVNWVFLPITTAYNLIRMRNLLEAVA